MQPSKLGTGVGAPMRRVEDGRFLRGAGRYVDDLPAADATRMVLLRSPHPHARLKRVVIDRGCHIPDGLVVGEDAHADAQRFLRTDSGIVLVTADMLAKLRH